MPIPEQLPQRLTIVRHGESEFNRIMSKKEEDMLPEEQLLLERLAATPPEKWGLSELGRQQAPEAGVWLDNNTDQPANAHHTSPMRRARQTATGLALPGAHWTVDKNLRERNNGDVEAVPIPDRVKRFPEYVTEAKRDVLGTSPPGGENHHEVAARMQIYFKRLVNQNHVIAVSHADAIRGAAMILGGIDERGHGEEVYNGGIVEYTRQNPENDEVTADRLWRRVICPWDESLSSNEWGEVTGSALFDKKMEEGVTYQLSEAASP